MANTIRNKRIFTEFSAYISTLSSSGAGVSLIDDPHGILKSLVEGANITLTDNGDSITITGANGPQVTVVANYSALPDPTTVSGLFYWCITSQGTKWLPGSLGGTYYSAGMYYSTGTVWSFMETAYQASLPTVNIGTVEDQFVSPYTFENADKWDTKVDTNAPITGDTKTKITYDAKGLVTSGADATTADISDSTDKRYVTDAELVVIGNTSNTNTGDNAANTTSNTYADGKVEDQIVDGVDTIAPSQNAVFDALALKQNTLNYITATTTFDFENEQDAVIRTVSSAVLTNANLLVFTIVPQETTATSLDDFKLNGVTFNIENIVDNTSFDIRATAVNSASGVYTIKYLITYI